MYIEGIFTQETTENMKNDFMKVLEEYINSIKILKINIENSDNTINKHIRNNILESIKETYNTFRLFLNREQRREIDNYMDILHKECI